MMFFVFFQKFFQKKLQITIFLFIVLVISGWNGYHYWGTRDSADEKPAKPIKTVEVERISHHTIVQTARLMGSMRAKRSTSLIAQASGILAPKKVPGAHLQKGDLIAELVSPDIQQTYELSIVGEKIAQQQYERHQSLQGAHVTSPKDLEDRHNALIEAQKIRAQATIAYEKTRFKAPFDGILGMYKIREGSHVTEGELIGVIYDPSEMVVEFQIPYPLLQALSLPAQVLIDHELYRLSYVQEMVDKETHMSPASVEVGCTGKDKGRCIIGATLPVDLIVAEKKNVLTVPYDGVFLKNGKENVYLIKEGKCVLTAVKLGIREKERVEVQSGVQSGDEVIIHGHERLSHGDAIQIHNALPKADSLS